MGKKERFYVDIMALQIEVTGSCNLVIVKYPNGETTKFIVDCGMFQEEEYSKYNQDFPFDADEIEFCLVTHNHTDHTGRLPLLVKKNFRNKIYTTVGTKQMLPLALYDSHKVMKDVAKRNHTSELYSEADVAQTVTMLYPCEYEETHRIDENIKATFFKNGHLPGAAMILVQISWMEDSINLLFTGDYNNKNMFFDVEDLPQWVLDLPLTVVQEATYGTTESTNKVETFRKNVTECMELGGTAVTLEFGLGRYQEVLYTLKEMQKDGLSTEIPIFADGRLGIAYTNMFLNDNFDIIKESMKDFLPENLTFVDKGNRDDVLTSQARKIIVTTSGMGSHGPAQIYIPEYIRRKNCLIQFTGYTAEGTLGRKLKDTLENETVTYGGIVLRKQADVEYTTEFSAHAKADEMIEFLKKFNNLKLVLVNHGQYNTLQKFAERIVRQVDPKDVAILSREFMYRVGPYGMIRSLTTKFD